MLPVAAELDFRRAGLPEPPPWKRDEDWEPATPGYLRVSGFVSKPELQKLNRNSIYVFVNHRLIRDRLVLHALTESYRNIIPPTSFPVVLLFLDMPPQEVDVNVHPAKTEVRFRQPSFVHDFLRDTVRTALIQARPAASFAQALTGGPHDLASSLNIDISPLPGEPSPDRDPARTRRNSDPNLARRPTPERARTRKATALRRPRSQHPRHPLPPRRTSPRRPRPALLPPRPRNHLQRPLLRARPRGRRHRRLHPFEPVAPTRPRPPRLPHRRTHLGRLRPPPPHGNARPVRAQPVAGSPVIQDTLNALSTLKPLGQIRDSFILATNDEGLWIIDQHVAHERILFEKVLRERQTEAAQRQRLLMPLLVDLLPAQMIRFAELAEELDRNGFEAEPFGPRTLAIKSAPVGLEGRELELTLEDLLSAPSPDEQTENAGTRARRIAASIACHAAIKINTPLDPAKLTWLLEALAKTEHPTSCPHGRPIALRYSHRDIARAFQRT